MEVREALAEDWGDHKPVLLYPISWLGDLLVNDEGVWLCVQFSCGMEGQQSLISSQGHHVCFE